MNIINSHIEKRFNYIYIEIYKNIYINNIILINRISNDNIRLLIFVLPLVLLIPK